MNRWFSLPLLLAAPALAAGRALTEGPSRPAPAYARFGCQGYLNLSPDGRWFTYCVGHEPRVTEVTSGATRGVTERSGEPSAPRWSRDGRRLGCYVERDGRKELRL